LFTFFGVYIAGLSFITAFRSLLFSTTTLSMRFFILALAGLCLASPYETVTNFFDSVVWPKPKQILSGHSRAPFFSNTGFQYRSRTFFETQDLHTFKEYFYATIPNPDVSDVKFTKAKIRRFIQSGNTAAVSVDITVTSTKDSFEPFKITEDAYIVFDQDDKIQKYDAIGESLVVWYARLGFDIQQQPNKPSPAQAVAGGICKYYMQFCNGSSKAFADNAACMAYYTSSSFALGNPEASDQNNLYCRLQFAPITLYNPKTYCPIIYNSAASDLCIDNATDTYTTYYANPLFPPLMAVTKDGKRYE